MDSITQAVLGATVAGAVAGKKCSPKVLAAGALLGTVPDLDVLISYGDPVSDVVKHRGFSHSIFVLLPFSLLLAYAWQLWKKTDWPFLQLWALVALALITHPLLDSLTAYGTQLFWPLPVENVAVSSLFIIDPLYTLPMLVLVLCSLMWRDKASKLCRIGLLVSSGYIIWSVGALHSIESRIEQQLVGTKLEGSPIFITPTPVNTILWRVVVLDGEQYWEGLTSLLDKDTNIDLLAMPRGSWLGKKDMESYQQLEHFTQGFMRYDVEDNKLKVTDLRLGMAGYHPFAFYLAEQNESEQWQAIMPERVDSKTVEIKHVPAWWLRVLGNQDINAELCHVNECPKS